MFYVNPRWKDIIPKSTIRTSIWFYSIYLIGGYVLFCFFFWASSHSFLAPTVEIGGIWPPKGIGVLDPWEIPFLNTPILLSSGAVVTWAHHAILAGNENEQFML
ncbi:Cytochrome c oxidase subunit 3 [Gossypium australe]|uniref:Cytochrome c oxidase subunit 3 n=1 Tax=Gossypium australe TaxID=47621 RepID=A0A5B6WZM7_9ROSI|nr:Cytochrome c oxidase subunit 3 [Gossypium australe]